MVASAQIILFLEMLENLKLLFSTKFFLKENEEHFRTFDNIKSIF
jgi:hypothetical protein